MTQIIFAKHLLLKIRPTKDRLFLESIENKRAQRALGRSPEEKVKGHSRAIYRVPQGQILNNFGRGPLDYFLYQILKLWTF